MTASVVVVGSLHLDVMVRAPALPRLGETMVGTSWAMKPGGKGGNQAVEAARYGASVAMVGYVGTDDFGDRLRANLYQHGVDTTFVGVHLDVPTGMSVAITEAAGDYGAVIVSGVNLALGSSEIAAAQPLIAAARWLLLQNEIPAESNLAAAGLARAAGIGVILNAAPARELPPEFAALIDILVVNALEAEALAGFEVLDLASAARAAEILAARVACAIVTAGGAGLAMAEAGKPTVTMPAHRITVVSTHGAGDAFVGVLAASLAAGASRAEALAHANAAAAVLVATPDEARDKLDRRAAARLLGDTTA